MPLPSRTVSVTVARPAAEVYAWLADPERWPAWASGLGDGLVREGDGWAARGEAGPVRVSFTPPNGFGVLDHRVELADGTTVAVPMRVVPNADGADVTLTLFRQPAMSDADYARDADWVGRDLARLKELLEGRQAS